MVGVQLLGAVAAESGGAPLSLGHPRQRGLLAWLALVHPRASSVDSIVEALWGEEPPTSARNAIQVYVSGLRKILRTHDVDLERVGDGYALRGRDLDVDVTLFDGLVAQGRAALRTGDLGQAVGVLEQALRVWADPPLGGLGDLAFIAAARTNLVETYTAALLELAQAYLRLGRADEAVGAARRLLADHPYDERAWAILARGHYAAGRQDEALDACRRARQLLLDELGVDPSPELAGLEGKILHHELDRPAYDETGEQSATPDPGPGLSPIPSPPDPLVGRDELLVEVVGIASSPGHFLTLCGMGGIGKTSLALAAGCRLAEAGLRVAFVALERDQAPVPALERVCRALGLDVGDDPVTVLAEKAGGLADVIILDNVEQIDGFGDTVPQWWSDRGPSLVVTSRRALHVRGEQLITVPPLSTTAEPGDDPAAVGLFLSSASKVNRSLDHDATRADAARLCTLLDGIPLAIELAAARTRVLTPRQLVARMGAASSLTLDGSSNAGAPARQASLARVLEATWTMLAGPSRDLLRLLAEIDGRAPLELIEPATGLDDSAFLDALDDLVTSGLVLSAGGSLALLAPVREYCRALPGRRPFTVRLVRRAVEFASDGPADIAGPDASAEVSRLRGADDALSSAITRAAEIGLAAEAAQLVLRLYRMWLLSGRIVEARRWIGLVEDLDGHDPVTGARLGLLAGTFASYVNDVDTIATLHAVLDQADDLGVPADRVLVNAWCCLAAQYAHHDRVSEALEPAARAAAAAQVSGSPALVSLARDLGAYVAAYAGDFESALTASLAGLEDARRSGDEYDIVLMLTQTSTNLSQLHRVNEALVLINEAFDRVGHFDVGPALGAVLLTRGMSHTVAGNLAVARSDLTAALRVTTDLYPDPLTTADSLFLLAHCAALAGDDELAARYFGASDALYDEHGVEPAQRITGFRPADREAIADRMGRPLFDLLSSAGRAEPDRVVAAVVATAAE